MAGQLVADIDSNIHSYVFRSPLALATMESKLNSMTLQTERLYKTSRGDDLLLLYILEQCVIPPLTDITRTNRDTMSATYHFRYLVAIHQDRV